MCPPATLKLASAAHCEKIAHVLSRCKNLSFRICIQEHIVESRLPSQYFSRNRGSLATFRCNRGPKPWSMVLDPSDHQLRCTKAAGLSVHPSSSINMLRLSTCARIVETGGISMRCGGPRFRHFKSVMFDKSMFDVSIVILVTAIEYIYTSCNIERAFTAVNIACCQELSRTLFPRPAPIASISYNQLCWTVVQRNSHLNSCAGPLLQRNAALLRLVAYNLTGKE